MHVALLLLLTASMVCSLRLAFKCVYELKELAFSDSNLKKKLKKNN